MSVNSSINSIWQNSLQPPTLKDHQVHIWRANLALSMPEIEQLTSFLSPDELDRANKFRFVQHQNRFIAARGILRQLLGNYLAVSPHNVTFTYSDRGKPQIEANFSLQFNLSHSEEYALFGFTLNHLIGVDLEHQRSMPDALKIAQRFFSPPEYKLLEQIPRAQQSQLFFQLWTAKEAYLKATGTGLSGSLATVEIAFDSNQSPCLAAIPAPEEISSWLLSPCSPASNYSGAIAIKSALLVQQISYWHWSPDLLC